MAIEKTINLNVDSKKATKGLKDLEKGIDGVNKEVKQTSQSTQAMNSTLDQATGGAVTKFNKFKGAIGSVTTGFKSLRVAIIATGIGALLIAVTALGQAFTRSEEGQNKFAKILGVIGSVTGNLLDLLADLGENIISVFEDPKQAIIDFKDLIVENITNRFNAILDTVGFLGSAISKVFSKDFKGALEDAKKAGSSFVDSFTGVENSIDKATNSVKEFGKEIKSDASAAAKIADQRANAEKKARDLIVERAEAERKIAELREKAADKENFTAQERIEFLKEAGAISEDIANKETEVARLRLEAKQTENALTKSNKSDLDEEAQLKADLINKETQRLKLQKALTAEITTTTREANKTTKESADKDVMTEEQKKDAIEKIQEAYRQKQKDRDAETELEKINLEEERKLAELDRLGATEEQKLAIKSYYSGLKTDVSNKEAEDEIALEEKVKNAKLGMAKNALGLIGQIAGKGSKIAKGVAIAQATISGVEGTINAFKTASNSPITTVFPAYPFVQAGLAAGFAATNIATIKSTDPSKGGGGSVKPPTSGGGSAPAPPSFNVVGASETSVLGDAVASQTNEPVQAYVVSNDVTTAQSMENNIVEGATI